MRAKEFIFEALEPADAIKTVLQGYSDKIGDNGQMKVDMNAMMDIMRNIMPGMTIDTVKAVIADPEQLGQSLIDALQPTIEGDYLVVTKGNAQQPQEPEQPEDMAAMGPTEPGAEELGTGEEEMGAEMPSGEEMPAAEPEEPVGAAPGADVEKMAARAAKRRM